MRSAQGPGCILILPNGSQWLIIFHQVFSPIVGWCNMILSRFRALSFETWGNCHAFFASNLWLSSSRRSEVPSKSICIANTKTVRTVTGFCPKIQFSSIRLSLPSVWPTLETLQNSESEHWLACSSVWFSCSDFFSSRTALGS